jgi:SAM-dependent methyltransferase
MITKKLFRVKIQHVLRNTGLLFLAEKYRYFSKVFTLKKRNRKFINQNPGFTLPPSLLAFDAYSSSHWEFYKLSGEITAKFLASVITKYFPTERSLKIYEWGCGPARIVRQLPATLHQTAEIYASDYNIPTIEWCKKNIPGIHFSVNGLQPPLSYANETFDFIYAISVFTHLSEKNGLGWANELYRVLKPGGVLLITTSGDRIYRTELLKSERKEYDRSGIVIRANYQEGKKMFLAMHSPGYVREKLLRHFEITEHVPGEFPFMRQDYWIARKK